MTPPPRDSLEERAMSFTLSPKTSYVPNVLLEQFARAELQALRDWCEIMQGNCEDFNMALAFNNVMDEIDERMK